MNKTLLIAGVVVLYGLSALFFRGTHPYGGSRSEPFEMKQQRRSIGTVLLVAGTLLLGVIILTQVLINKN